jgi:cytochrome c oxidase subunit III
MGDLIPYRSPHVQRDFTSYLGMVIFLGSWAVLFAALFFSYLYLRAHTAVWPPMGTPRLPLGLPALNTGVIASSSVLLGLGLMAIRRRRNGLAGGLILATFVLGVLFLVLQTTVWLRMWSAGLVPRTGQYASVFYALTWFHALHVAIGLLALATLCVRTWLGKETAARHHAVRLWAIYWHFVGIVWGLLFLLVYLV